MTNNTRTLTKLEELLYKIDGRQGLVIGGDYNVIVNHQLDQHGYDTPHLRTKAVKHHNEWEASGTLIDIYRKKHKKAMLSPMSLTLSTTEKIPNLAEDWTSS